MGEWSDYFEDFPEEAPQPPSQTELAKERLENEIRAINADAFALIEQTMIKAKLAEQKEKEKYLESVEECLQCGENALHVYKLKETMYLCECQSCCTYPSGQEKTKALNNIILAYGDGLDWTKGSLFKSLLNEN